MNQKLFVTLVLLVISVQHFKSIEINQNQTINGDENTPFILTTHDSYAQIHFNKHNLIKAKIANFMVKARLLSYRNESVLSNDKNQTNTTRNNCIDPDYAIIEAKKYDFYRKLYDGFGILDQAAVKKVIKSLVIPLNASINNNNGKLISSVLDEDFIYGSKECNEKIVKSFKENEKTLCPWHYKIQYRTNRYPRTRMQAKCNCIDCYYVKNHTAFGDQDKYQCREIRKLMPVVIRDQCVNGVYEWKSMFEYVSVGCMCTRNQTFISID